MPGGRSRHFRLGDRSELLVQHLLSGVAFTTPVPRQEDIGIDFFCSLIVGYGAEGYGAGNLLMAGPVFSVQSKSNADPVEYRKPHEIEWISNQENPFLLCVADRNVGSMDVYSTWNLLCALKQGWKGMKPANCIRLCPGRTSGDWRGVEDQEDGSQNVLLGKPIIRITHEEIFDEASTQRIAEVLGAWIALDRENIVNCKAELNWVVGPITYVTGSPPGPVKGVTFYWSARNLPKSSDNLARSAVGLWRVLNASGTQETWPMPWREAAKPLRELLCWILRADLNLKNFLPDIETDCTAAK